MPPEQTSIAPGEKASASGSAMAGKAASPPRTIETLVVIGNGMASYKLCERLSRLNVLHRYRVVVIGEESRPAYDRVHLTECFQGKTPDRLLLATREWYEQNGIDLRTGDRVTAIDRERRKVRSARGKEVQYDKLVFATGSRAFIPTAPGFELPGVFVYRTLDDLENIKLRAAGCKRAAVLGGGLLGLEIARALRDAGLQTWVIERGSTLLARQLSPDAGEVLRAEVEKTGIHVCSQRETERIESIGSDLLLQFNTGECLRAQLVIVAAGIRPRDELATQCGLETSPRGGIKVNDLLQTSDPGIYAIGECASHRDRCYGLAAPGYLMADVLAENLAGKRRTFIGADQSTRLKLPGIAVAAVGDFQGDGDSIQWKAKDCYRQFVVSNGRLIGATVVGDWPEFGRVHEVIERKGRLWRWQRRRFLDTGNLWRGETAGHVSQWPETALVCNCLGIRRGVLSQACAQGCATVEQLSQKTGASTVCGSCRPLLAALVDAPLQSIGVPGLKWLATASAAAFAVALAISLIRPIPFAASVQAASRVLDVLWRDSGWKQISGFTLLGLAVASLVLSLRKRIAKFQFGEFGHWRAVHAWLGMLTLVALVTHTGFRLGHNFNAVLMADFLALALAGALTGGVAALERRLSARGARQLRSFWTGAHILMVWPLPVLILFHVLMAYYF